MNEDIKGYALTDGWSLETADRATVFVRYKDIDVVAVWTPFDQPGQASVTIPSIGQLQDMLFEAVDNDDAETYTEWATSDEIAIDLSKHVAAVDKLRVETDAAATRNARKARIKDLAVAVLNGSDDNAKALVKELDL